MQGQISLNKGIRTDYIHQTAVSKVFERVPKNDDPDIDLDVEFNSILFRFLDHEDVKKYLSQLIHYYSLHKWHNGKILEIEFSCTFTMKDDAIQLMVKFLQRNLKDLTKLKVTFVNCFFLEDKGMENLSEIARHLPKLKELELAFAGFYMTSKGLERAGYEISRQLKNLESFRLHFRGSLNRDRDDMKMFFLAIGKHFSKLKNLRLEFFKTGLDIETIDFMAKEILKNFKDLTEFTLEIQEGQIEYEDVKHVLEILSFIPKFDFIFNEKKITSTIM